MSCSGAHLYHQYLSGIKLCPYPCRFFPILQYSYDAEFIHNFSKTNKIQKLKHIIAFFQILILLNGFHKYAPKELEIKETTETAPSTSCLDIFLKSDTNWSTRLLFCHKKIDTKMPTTIVYEAYISQLISYARISRLYSVFL